MRATMAGVSFMPSTAWIGTDMLTLRPDVKMIIDPYSGRELVAFPALRCDVAVIHALVADRSGNARLNRNRGVDHELPLVADTVIITAEEIVDEVITDVDLVGSVVTAGRPWPAGGWARFCFSPVPGAAGADFCLVV